MFRVVTGYVCIHMVSIGVFTPYFAQDRLCDCSYLFRALYPIRGSFFFALVLLSGWGYSSAMTLSAKNSLHFLYALKEICGIYCHLSCILCIIIRKYFSFVSYL